MCEIQLDVNDANSVAIDVANDVLPVLTNQNKFYMPKFNDFYL